MANVFLLVDATDLREWAKRRDAQATLPEVLRRLVLATVDDIQRIDFRAGEGVQIGGWDGTAQVTNGNAFVPTGCSAWETGCDQSVKGKADGDYEKRTSDALGLERADTTYVFVTPRRWSKKREWAAEKRKDGQWKDVRAYDADDLHTWLEKAPAVHIWLSRLLGKRPRGVEDVLTFWNDWSNVTEPTTSAAFVVAGREAAASRLQAWMTGPPAALALQGETEEEATAFLAGAMQSLPVSQREFHLSRGIIVREADAWGVVIENNRPLLLVPSFRDRGLVAAAIARGHHVLIPLDKTEPRVGQTLELERPRRQQAKAALEAMGVTAERSDKLASVGRASLGAVRRALARHRAALIPEWARGDAGKDALPALLAGRWNDRSEADQKIVAALAGRSYPEYRDLLERLARQPDPPVRLIGAAWTIVSKDDAWELLSHLITDEVLTRLETAVLTAGGEVDPKFELGTDVRWQAAVLGKTLAHSTFLREGLADTLALMAAHHDVFPLKTALSGEAWADRIVRRLLETITSTRQSWASLGAQMRSLAEASPDAFLDAVEQGLAGDPPLLGALFENSDPMFSTSPHTDLLWALETIARAPAHLGRATILLARLARIDPGGKTANRPAQSLHEIFLPWHPSTAAGVDARLRVLDALRKRESEVAWNLLFGLVPSGMGVAMSTAKPRHRDWVPEESSQVNIPELTRVVIQVLAWLREDAGTDARRWAKLIETLDDVADDAFEEAVTRLASLDADAMPTADRIALWGTLRNFIARHREYADARWAMPAEKISRLDEIYDRLEPVDPIEKIAWLFERDAHPPKCKETGWRAREAAIAEMQSEAVTGLLASTGIDRLLSLADRVAHAFDVGLAAAGSSLLDDEILGRTLASPNEASRQVAFGFLSGRSSAKGAAWLHGLRSTAAWRRWGAAQRADYFRVLPFAGTTWDLLTSEDEEVQRLYWTQIGIGGRGEVSAEDRDRAARALIKYGRLTTTVKFIALYSRGKQDPVEAKLIVDLLEAIARGEEASDDRNLGALAYEIAELITLVEASPDVEEERVARLEWLFLPIVHHYRPAKVLHNALANDPALFLEVVKLVYKPRNEKHSAEVSLESRNRATLGYQLLHEWKRVPGSRNDGSIDWARLKEWVRAARELAAAADRSALTDLQIGQMLIRCPVGTDGAWPHEAVRDLFEELASDEIERGVETGIYNDRGVVSRSIGEGGNQERDIAERYHGYAKTLADAWPRTSRLMKRIADDYVSDARREDIQAELDDALEN